MRRTILAALLLSSPAWGAGVASEQLCDDTDGVGGVTCMCSATLTGNDGVHHNQDFQPIGQSPQYACHPTTTITHRGSDETITSVVAADMDHPLSVGGDGYVLRTDTNSIYKIDVPSVTFTNMTYCQRWYEHWGAEWNCNNDCNVKGPRWENESNSIKTQSGISTNSGYGGKYYAFKFGATDANKCENSVASGCTSAGRPLVRGDEITWEDGYQKGWVRIELCVDHNLSSNQVATANSVYGSDLVYPGSNRMYMRARITQVTGGTPGAVQIHGPGYRSDAISTPITGSLTRLWTSGTGSKGPPDYLQDRGRKWIAYVMRATKSPADPNYWIGAALEVAEDSHDGVPISPGTSTPTAIPDIEPTPTPIATTALATPTATAPSENATPTPTATPASSSNQTLSSVEAIGCPDSLNPNPAILFCDNFDDGIPISEKWNTYNSGDDSYVPISGIGVGGSTAMRASWTQGQVSAGSFSIGLGGLPAYYLPGGGGENWQHVISPGSEFRELYFRQYLKMGSGWSGVPRKFSRVRVLSDPQPGDGAHPTAFQGHFWQQINTNQGGTIGALMFDNTRGVDENGVVIDRGNNSGTSIWLPKTRGSTEIFQDNPQESEWICIEARVKLNDPGSSNGVEEFWINGQLDASRTDQNHIGVYTEYGLNQVVFDNYWNGGSPQYNELYRDNIVISTEPIGCLSDSESTGNPDDGSLGKPGTPYVIGQ